MRDYDAPVFVLRYAPNENWRPACNNGRTKTIWEVTPYYTRSCEGGCFFVRGEKPPELIGSTRISVRRWQHYQTLLHRENPIAKGLEYLQVLDQESIRSYAQAGKILGVCRQRVHQLVALVTKLPDEIKETLLAENDPDILRHFTERNLRPIAVLADKQAQLKLFNQMMVDAKSSRPDVRKVV